MSLLNLFRKLAQPYNGGPVQCPYCDVPCQESDSYFPKPAVCPECHWETPMETKEASLVVFAQVDEEPAADTEDQLDGVMVLG